MDLSERAPSSTRYAVPLAAAALGTLLILLSLALQTDAASHLPVPPRVLTWIQSYVRLAGAFFLLAAAWIRYPRTAGIGTRIDGWLGVHARAEKILLVLLVLYVVGYAGFTIHRHNTFNSTTFDLGIQDQVVWNTSQGRFFEESFEVNNYLGDHFQPLMALLAIPYRVYPSVYWLLIFQTVCLSLGGIPVFRLARRRFGSPLAGVAFAAAYYLYPAVGFINRFDFHFEIVVIPLLLGAWAALAEDKDKLASLLLGLALFGKEEIGLTVAVFAIAAGIIFRKRRFAALWFIAGLSFSLLALFVLIPAFRNGPSDTLSRYGWLGRTPPEMLKRIVFDPLYVLRRIQSIGWFYMLAQLFAPVAYSPFLSPVSLLLVLPGLAYNLLSGFAPQHTAYYQYVSPLIPGVFIGAVHGLSRAGNALGRRFRRYQPHRVVQDYKLLALLFLITCSVFAFVTDNPVNTPAMPSASARQPNEAAVREAIALISDEARMFTTNTYGSHLSQRRFLKVSCCTPQPLSGLRESDFALLNLLDFRFDTPEQYRTMLTLAAQEGFGLIYEQDAVVLLQRGGGDRGAVLDLSEKWLP